MKDFNFFRPYLEVKTSSKKKSGIFFKFLVAFAGVVLIGLAAVYFFQNLEKKNLENEVATLDETLNKTEMLRSLQEVEQLEADVYAISKKKLLLLLLNYSLESNNKVTGPFMDFMANEILEGLYLNKITIDGNTINIQGKAIDRVTIAKFEHNLRSSKKFNSILINSIINKGQGESLIEGDSYQFNQDIYDFNMNITERGGVDSEY